MEENVNPLQERLASLERDYESLSQQIESFVQQRFRLEGAILLARELLAPPATEPASHGDVVDVVPD